MRGHILRTLLLKESLRHLAARGGIFIAFLLIAVSLTVSLFGKEKEGPIVGGVQRCYVDYWEDGPWIAHLKTHPPSNKLDIRFRPEQLLEKDENGVILYQQSTAAVQIRLNGQDKKGHSRYLVWLWHPGDDPNVLAPFAAWFWKETLRYFQAQNVPVEITSSDEQIIHPPEKTMIQVLPPQAGPEGSTLHRYLYWSLSPESERRPPLNETLEPPIEIEIKRNELSGRGDFRSMFATAFVIFALCFFSVYLMPVMTCEERERGVLLAQALSPASPDEILAAKFLFYPTTGMALAVLLAGIYSPVVLLRPFFWLGLIATALGYLGVGMTISSLARTQRAASMGAMCYMLAISLFLVISNRFGIIVVNYLSLEFYCPRIIHAALVDTIEPYRWELVRAFVLACIWVGVASHLFRKRGWQ